MITTKGSHKRIAVERGDVPPDDVYIVRSGPDLARLTIYPPEPAWRKGKQHLLVYLGEICKQDGVDHLVRAVKLLRDELGRDDFHCVLVGGGPYQPNEWSDKSTMNKIMEYMYFGLPIVAYDLTENRLSADAAAVYAAANREHELARSITGLLDDPARGAETGAVGRRRLHDHLAWEHSAILLAAYQRLLPMARQRPPAIVATVRDSEVLALERGDIT